MTATHDPSILSNSAHHSTINVLHVIGTLEIGGAESQLVTLAPILNNGHYDITVCCLQREGVQADILRAKGIKVVSLNMRLRYWFSAVIKLYRLIKQLNVQVVHTHLFHSSIWGRVVGKIAGVPVMMNTEHGMTLWKKWYHLFLARLTNSFTDKIIAVSEDIRQIRIDRENVPPQKIVFIPNSVNIEQFSQIKNRDQVRSELGIEPNTCVIGTVARLVPPKRLDYLLETAHLVREKKRQVHFLIIGDGPLRQKLEAQAEQLDLLTEHVQFLGSRHDIPDLLSALDIFVLSSEREGLPVSMLEAMAASLPIATTAVGGIPEVIQNGDNGLLVPPHEPDSLARAILSLVTDDTLRRLIAKQGYQTVKDRFSAVAVGQQITTLYDELLESKKKVNTYVH